VVKDFKSFQTGLTRQISCSLTTVEDTETTPTVQSQSHGEESTVSQLNAVTSSITTTRSTSASTRLINLASSLTTADMQPSTVASLPPAARTSRFLTMTSGSEILPSEESRMSPAISTEASEDVEPRSSSSVVLSRIASSSKPAEQSDITPVPTRNRCRYSSYTIVPNSKLCVIVGSILACVIRNIFDVQDLNQTAFSKQYCKHFGVFAKDINHAMALLTKRALFLFCFFWLFCSNFCKSKQVTCVQLPYKNFQHAFAKRCYANVLETEKVALRPLREVINQYTGTKNTFDESRVWLTSKENQQLKWTGSHFNIALDKFTEENVIDKVIFNWYLEQLVFLS